MKSLDKKTSLKLGIAVALLTLPYWLGFALGLLGFDTASYFLMGIIPQLAIDPYYSHYGARRFADGWLAPVLHWSLLLMLYWWLSRGRSLMVSLLMFAGLAALSVVLVHVLLSVCGCKFELDTI